MVITELDAKLYISVMIMLAVLIVNIGLISWDNLKLLRKLNTWGKDKRNKSKFKEF